MKKMMKLFVVCMMFVSMCACSSTKSATMVIKNANIITEDETVTSASAIAIDGEDIVYVGDDEGVEKYISDTTEVYDLNGKMVTPSLIDAHTHPATVGFTDWHVNMHDPETVEEVTSFISDYLSKHSKEEEPYVYFGYYPSDMFGKEGPKKEVLDAICDDRPILVRDFSDHASWVNSKFIELLDADEEIAKDDNFVKDENGEPTGWIKEFTYQNYLENMFETINFYPPEEPTEEVMSIVLDDLKSWGVTGVFDAYIEDEMQCKSIHDMDEAGKLNMYYDMSVVLEEYEDCDEVIDTIKYYNETYSSKHMKVDTMKIFYDGTNELGDAALVDGTVENPDDHGFLLMNLEETKDVIKKCNENKVDVHFHMVGDLAFRQVCDAVEQLQEEIGDLDIQVELCHCEYVNPADYERPAKLGIIINWTPHWSGGYFGEASLEYLGQERYDNMYNFNPMIESGAIVTFGSDVYDMTEEYRANPYFGMQTAMTRVDIDYPLDCGMREKETSKLSLENLLKGYTIQAAKQLRIDDIAGSITVGKKANINIYDEDLFSVDPMEFKDVLPSFVMFEGKILHGSIE